MGIIAAYFSIIKRLFIYLTPSFPLSFKGEGEEIRKRGYAFPGVLFGIGACWGEREYVGKEKLCLLKECPFPLKRGRG